MTLVQAIMALFAQTAPAGADFEGAFNALKGKKETDLSQADATTLDELAETFQDFVGDPATWLKSASASDPRRSWWEKLAKALGASVTSSAPPSSTSPPSTVGPTAAPAVDEPEPEQGIDPDALAGGAAPPGRREGGGGGRGGIVVSTGDDDEDRPRREKKKRGERRDRGRDDEEEDDDRDDRRGRQQPRDRKPPEPPPPPKPLIDVGDRTIPPITRQILASRPYLRWRDWIVEAYRVIREGTEAERLAKRGELQHMKSEIASMKAGSAGEALEAQSGFHLERLIEVLEAGRDLAEPAWFQANYITGSYDPAG